MDDVSTMQIKGRSRNLLSISIKNLSIARFASLNNLIIVQTARNSRYILEYNTYIRNINIFFDIDIQNYKR